MPFGPDISWPTGYSDLEYRDGDYRYQSPSGAQPLAAPPVNKGEHPYAAFSDPGYGNGYAGDTQYTASSIDDFGYGDPGYSNLGYDGPASEDAGVAGTRTVRGFVEPRRRELPSGGYSRPSQPGYGDDGPGYDPGNIESAYPVPETYREPDGYQAPDIYREPWDYDQPLRYEGEEPSYPGPNGSGSGPVSPVYGAPVYDPADYNGSDYSRPGIGGPGYDLSGILRTSDFEAVGYDEPSYDRLSYDDPRYDDDPRQDGGPRQDGPGYDGRSGYDGGSGYGGPSLDDTRLDSLWLSGGEDFRQDSNGYGNDGFGGGGTDRSEYPGPSRGGGMDFAGRGPAANYRGALDETRLDLADPRGRLTRMDLPVYDERRIDNLRATGPIALRAAATSLLAPPEDQPVNWAEETSLDTFGDLDLDEMAPADVPAAFMRPSEEPAEDDTAARRAIGKRRGRSGDRRQWLALGAIAVVAAGAISGVLMKYVFTGPGGPAHTVVAPNEAGPFTRMPNLEKQMKVNQLAQDVIKTSSGQASDVVSAVYQEGSSAPGSNPQIFMFVGGHLANASPPTSITDFTQNPAYRGAKVIPVGALGGEGACAEETSNGEDVAMCVWFDNDTFGELVSPTMTPAKLGSTMDMVRPSLELYAK
jgi:hypothetical protein